MEKNATQVLNHLSEQLGRCVVPIFSNNIKGKPEACGTGFLVLKDRDVFLITAGHVLSDIEDGKDLFFYINHNTVRHLVASYRKTLTFNQNHKDDLLDTGVLKLDDINTLLGWQSEKRPIPFHLLRPTAIPRAKKHYLITGYPSSKSRHHLPTQLVRSKPYSIYCMSTQGSYEDLKLNEHLHIALDFNVKDVHEGDFGPSVNFPSPQGMSGSPVWILFDEEGRNSIETQISGIMIEHWKDKHLLIAADISTAVDIIQRGFAI